MAKKNSDLKQVSSRKLFLELEQRRDVRFFNAGKHRPYDIRAKYGALPLDEDNAPVYALAVREEVFQKWSRDDHVLNNQSKRGTNKKKNQVANKIHFPFFVVRSLFFFVLGCLIAHFVISPLFFS